MAGFLSSLKRVAAILKLDEDALKVINLKNWRRLYKDGFR